MKLSETEQYKYLDISKYSLGCEFDHANTNTSVFFFKQIASEHADVDCWKCTPVLSYSYTQAQQTQH